MPCFDAEAAQDRREAAVKFAKMEAMLCATLNALRGAHNIAKKDVLFTSVYDWINYKEAGFTREELVKWASDHDQADADRRAREREVEAYRLAQQRDKL